MTKNCDRGDAPPHDGPSGLDQLTTQLSAAIGGPAQTILSLADEVMETALGTVQREQIRHIRVAAENLLGVVSDLTDYVRMDGASLTLLKSPFSLRDHVAHVAGGRVRAAQKKGLLLRAEVDGDVPDALTGDPGRLGQVLGHLLDVAIAATAEGEIVLRVEPEFITQNEATLSFAISDTGRAFPQDVLRSGEATPEAAGGLGFIVARRLIEVMGGQLRAGERVDRGNMLSFSIAFGISGENRSKPAQQRFESLVAVPVLLVSDDANEREELAKLCQSWHMHPLEADSGEMAIAILERSIETDRPIPLVIFTNRVQGHDGFMLAMRIKRHPQANTASLIMLTSEGRRGDAIKCRENGVAGYLPKPINPHDLREAVNTIMGVRAAEYAPTLVTRHSLREKRQGAAILLVEDDRDSQLLAAHFLDRDHFSVALATNGAEALARTEQQQFDLILLDMALQGLDGLAVARKIRAAEKITGGEVPIIAISTATSLEQEKRYKAAGITDVLIKPLKRDVLLAMVFRYVRAG